MESRNEKPTGLAAIESLPREMQDFALVPWPTTTTLMGFRDIESARKALKDAGVPLVELGPRKTMPTWGDLRAHIQSRKTVAA